MLDTSENMMAARFRAWETLAGLLDDPRQRAAMAEALKQSIEDEDTGDDMRLLFLLAMAAVIEIEYRSRERV